MADDSDDQSSVQDAEGSSQDTLDQGMPISFECRAGRACDREPADDERARQATGISANYEKQH